MKNKELQAILDNSLSVSSSTYFVSALYVISWALFISFLVLGIGLLLESTLHYKIFLNWVSRQLSLVLNEEQRWKIATSFGIVSLSLSVVFGCVIYLCRMILRRNHFIIEIEDWIATNLKDIKLNKK